MKNTVLISSVISFLFLFLLFPSGTHSQTDVSCTVNIDRSNAPGLHFSDITVLVNVNDGQNFSVEPLSGTASIIEDGATVVANPHKVYGPETNDLVLQLRKRGIDKIILAGMSANLCVEAHLRELLEQGFEVAVVSDATAAAQAGELDGYAAAMANFRFLASTVWTTAEAVDAVKSAASTRAEAR